MSESPEREPPSDRTAPPPPSTIRYESARPPSAGPGSGFVVGSIVWALFLLLQNSRDKDVAMAAGFLGFFGVALALPLIGIAFALRKASRQFGVGLLLASGLGWLILLAICGGRR
ncbi:MAG: hypothetical protein HZA93_20690 [Verrucomicrobia bacterium]|nr:hypothetical protein [Verrucomicrobiota bacterium]